jgi:hypothetical protein
MTCADSAIAGSPSRRLTMSAVAILAVLAGLVLTPAAMAGKPKGEYAVFNDCPLGTSGVTQCVYVTFSSGEVALDGLDIPIMHSITLQGGLIANEKEERFVNTTEGQTLSKSEEEVPGGIDGIVPTPENEKLTVGFELVGSVAINRSNLAAGKGVALTLPVRAHLHNPSLGEACYIGTSTGSVTLSLTTGATSPREPNKPIKGSPGEHETKEGGNLVAYKNDTLVENDFTVPGAKGCGLGELFNSVLDSKYKLPAAEGHSTAVLKGTSEFASAEAVRASE